MNYILVREKFRNQLKDCNAFPEADIDSYHNLIIMKCELKLKEIIRGKRKSKPNLEKLKMDKIKAHFQKNTKELANKPKKIVAEVCANHRTIGVLLQFSKILT